MFKLWLFALCLMITAVLVLSGGPYPACKDGSGGLCVKVGTCPPDKKPKDGHKPGSCAFGNECCFGPPSDDKSCKGHGGECMPAKDCKRHIIAEANDCDKGKKEACCILNT